MERQPGATVIDAVVHPDEQHLVWLELLPADACEIIDTWNVGGLRATRFASGA